MKNTNELMRLFLADADKTRGQNHNSSPIESTIAGRFLNLFPRIPPRVVARAFSNGNIGAGISFSQGINCPKGRKLIWLR